MAGNTEFHMTPQGLMRCRHGRGGASGKPRACPYGGPVTNSSDRMALPQDQRSPIIRAQAKPTAMALPPFTPLPKQQAMAFLRKEADRGLTEEQLEEWLNRDNRKQVAALQAAARVVDNDVDLATSLLEEAGLLQTGIGHYSETTMNDYRYTSLVGGDLRSGGTYASQVSADSIRRSLASHRRTDRSTLLVALDADPGGVSRGDAIFYALMAKNELEALNPDPPMGVLMVG